VKRVRRARGLWLLVAVALLSGCADGGAYWGSYQGAGYGDAYVSPLPPALRNTDPALRQWYTAPYFNPYESP
jgi:hypothetical protein